MATIEGTATEFSHRETLKEDFDGIKTGIHDSLSSSKDLIKDLVFAIKAQWFTKEVPIEPEIIAVPEDKLSDLQLENKQKALDSLECMQYYLGQSGQEIKGALEDKSKVGLDDQIKLIGFTNECNHAEDAPEVFYPMVEKDAALEKAAIDEIELFPEVLPAEHEQKNELKDNSREGDIIDVEPEIVDGEYELTNKHELMDNQQDIADGADRVQAQTNAIRDLDALRKDPAPEVATAESPIQLPYIQTDNPYLPIILDQNTQFKDGLPQDPVRQCLDNQAQQMAANIVQPGRSILTFPVFEQNFFMNPFTEVMPAGMMTDNFKMTVKSGDMKMKFQKDGENVKLNISQKGEGLAHAVMRGIGMANERYIDNQKTWLWEFGKSLRQALKNRNKGFNISMKYKEKPVYAYLMSPNGKAYPIDNKALGVYFNFNSRQAEFINALYKAALAQNLVKAAEQNLNQQQQQLQQNSGMSMQMNPHLAGAHNQNKELER